MNLKVELVPASKAADVCEKALRLCDPELWAERRKYRAKAKAKARRTGEPAVFYHWHGLLEPLGLVDLNRPRSDARVELYQAEMEAGRWYFTPDPIVITREGQIVNGQHRLQAADYVDWSKVAGEPPLFLVVWGVDNKTALLIDEAKRSPNDRRHIALGYARAA